MKRPHEVRGSQLSEAQDSGGQQVLGQATQDLPRIQLDIDAGGEIRAVGVQGLIYGRQSNVMTQEVSA